MPNTGARHPFVAWLLLIAAVSTILASPSAQLSASAGSQPVRLISSDASHAVIEFAMPTYSLEEVTVGGETCMRPAADGYDLISQPGKPQLLQVAQSIGLPPTGTYYVQILDTEESAVSLAHPICPGPTPLIDRDALPDDPAYGAVSGYTFERDAGIYGRDAPYPAQAAEVVELGKMRGNRIAQATFSPLRYNPVQAELQVTRRLVLEVRFDWEPSLSATSRQQSRSPAFDRLLSQTLLNYDEAQDWQAPSATSAPLVQGASSPSPAYKVIVDATGLYRMTYSYLQAAGLPVAQINPASFELSTGGNPVSIRVVGNGDAHFDANEAVEFYGYVPESRYTEHNVYWLRYNGTAQQPMTARSVTPVSSDPDGVSRAVARYEPNTRYDSLCEGADGDHWFVAELRATYAPQHTASLSLQPLYGASFQAEVRVGLVMKRGTAHHIKIAVNGVSVYDYSWTDSDPFRDPYPYTASALFNGSLLRTGANSVLVTVDGANEITWLDFVELDYAVSATSADEITFYGQTGTREYTVGGFSGGPIQVYDITDRDAPVQLVNAVGASSGPQIRFSDTRGASATYYALRTTKIRQPPSIYADTLPALALQANSNGADYLVISHADFIDAIQPLVALRQSEGLQVQVVDVQDVYDEFNAGRLSPQAIRDFISYAYHSWATPPTYVLLVGDGSYDFLNHAGWNPPNYMPPYLQMVERGLWGESAETAADNRYADVDPDDPLPLADVFIGRLPVRSAAEAATVVQKIIAYEQNPAPGSWNMRHVFTIDIDESGFFETIVEGAYGYIQSPFYKQVIDLNATTVPLAKQQVMDAWNAGALFMTYAGNGSWHQWSGEQLLHIDDVANMNNGGRLPVMLSMTCYTGYFQHPEYGTLDETMLRRSGGGAVATFSPSELTSGHDVLLRNFYDAVFDQGLAELGPAIAASKSTLSTAYTSLVDTYHLFGDPAMNLQLDELPSGGSVYLPAVLRNY
jgi:hypothetical protein